MMFINLFFMEIYGWIVRHFKKYFSKVENFKLSTEKKRLNL